METELIEYLFSCTYWSFIFCYLIFCFYGYLARATHFNFLVHRTKEELTNLSLSLSDSEGACKPRILMLPKEVKILFLVFLNMELRGSLQTSTLELFDSGGAYKPQTLMLLRRLNYFFLKSSTWC